MEVIGKIFKILPEQKGESTRGVWVKQDFVIETEEQFPRKVCFSLWGEDKCAGLKKLALGDKVVVSFNAESREYNERWFTDLRCWKLEKQINQNLTAGTTNSHMGNSEANYQPSSSSNTTVLEQVSDEFTPDDDLPF